MVFVTIENHIFAIQGAGQNAGSTRFMKLLFIIPSITNYFTFLEDLIEELNGRNHEVHLATSRKHIARISAYGREIKCAVHDIDFPRAINPFRHYSASKAVRALAALHLASLRSRPLVAKLQCCAPLRWAFALRPAAHKV